MKMGTDSVQTSKVKWHLSGTASDKIASIMLNGPIDSFLTPVQKLFQTEQVPYSGIIMSTNEEIAVGEKIEKSCYNKGGFIFLYKNYSEQKVVNTEFPVDSLIGFLKKITLLYSKEIIKEKTISIEIDSCWAVCQREGDYGTLHNHTSPQKHTGELYSGMLYLQTPKGINPETFPDGCLHLLGRDEIVYIPPIPACITLWPGNLVHGIHPFRGEGDRLGIAFNVIINKSSINQ